MDDAALGVGFELDLPKGRFVLVYVLLEDVEQRLGLLGAQVDALKIVDGHVIRGSLVDPAEHEKEIPKIHADLNAIGIVLPVLGSVNQLNLGRGLLRHTSQRITGAGRRLL